MNSMDPIIERFRFAHHTVARMFAAGMTIQEVTRRTGFTPRRLSILLNDPTFQELIAHYRKPHIEKLDKFIEDHYEEMESVFSGMLRHIRQHIEDADEIGENIPLAQARAVVADIGDRIGYSKHTIKTNISVDFAEALDRAIERSGKRDSMKVIEGRPSGQLPNSAVLVGRSTTAVPRRYTK